MRTKPVDEVYIAGDGPKQAAAVQHAISVCESLGVPFALPAYTFRLQRARPLLGKAVADGYLHYAVVEAKIGQRALKRICDVLIASVALWLLAPLLLAAAALVKASSRGPVLFRQERCGLHGRRFEMFKFRSMLADAEQRRKTLEALNECSGPVFKIRNDPRVTRVGGFLRKYSIDEFPQLINVLRGDMSIVGPRPPLPDEVAKYQPWQLRRLSVRPGLTCLWQVSAGRHEMSFEEWMYLDLQYVDHWNLLKDAEVMLRTIPVVISGGSASSWRTAALNSDQLNGLTTYADAPACSASARSSGRPRALMTRMGTSWWAAELRMNSQICKPLTSGSIRSRQTRSRWPSPRRRIALRPSAASMTWKARRWSCRFTSSRSER